MRLVALLLLVACATPAPPPPVHQHDDATFGLALIARVLADGCTSRPTDAVLIEHTTFLLQACHLEPHKCIRHVCVRLGRSDEEDDSVWR